MATRNRLLALASLALFALPGFSQTTTAPAFTYQLIVGTSTTTIKPGTMLSLPDTAVGSSTLFSINVQNPAVTAGTISSIALNGPLAAVNVPLLPVQVPAAGSLLLTFAFDPTTTGPLAGHVAINADQWELDGNGIGSQLTYDYLIGTSDQTVPAGGAVALSPVTPGSTERAVFTIHNTGTSAAVVSDIAVANSSVFTLDTLPSLPATIAPAGVLGFGIDFAPLATGVTTASLIINGTSFALSGTGGALPALPAYQLSGPSGAVPAASQQTVSLALSQPYPLALTGTLTLTVDADPLPADPAVQFSTGGRQVAFAIPANSTSATFTTGGSQISFQTGTVASAIAVTPTFVTAAGANVTPASPASLQVSVASSAPQLLSVQASAATANSLTLSILGYATSRALTSLAFQFTAASGFTLSSSSFTVDVSGDAGAWFYNSGSQAFGGQFLVTVPFSFAASSSTVTSPLSAIASVSVTATNGQGTSNAVSASVQP
jgi:hypothetical protein